MGGTRGEIHGKKRGEVRTWGQEKGARKKGLKRKVQRGKGLGKPVGGFSLRGRERITGDQKKEGLKITTFKAIGPTGGGRGLRGGREWQLITKGTDQPKNHVRR